MSGTLVFVSTGPYFAPKHSLNYPLLNLNPLSLPFHYTPTLPYPSYHALMPNVSRVIPCSIATCKSIGQIHTNKIYFVLLDSGSSKTLIHKCIVMRNYQLIHSNDNLTHLFPCRKYHIYKPCSLTKFFFLKFNCNMVVNGHPTLLIDARSFE